MNFRMVADVRSMSNYYPYGMQIEAGSWSGSGYNYGYNGMQIFNSYLINI